MFVHNVLRSPGLLLGLIVDVGAAAAHSLLPPVSSGERNADSLSSDARAKDPALEKLRLDYFERPSDNCACTSSSARKALDSSLRSINSSGSMAFLKQSDPLDKLRLDYVPPMLPQKSSSEKTAVTNDMTPTSTSRQRPAKNASAPCSRLVKLRLDYLEPSRLYAFHRATASASRGARRDELLKPHTATPIRAVAGLDKLHMKYHAVSTSSSLASTCTAKSAQWSGGSFPIIENIEFVNQDMNIWDQFEDIRVSRDHSRNRSWRWQFSRYLCFGFDCHFDFKG
jgi:hypothetical protein